MSVVSYINRQGGIRSEKLYRLAERLLVWAQCNLRSLRAAHVPGILNIGPDRLSRNNVPAGEWSLHPQTVHLLWKKFGRAEVDLFASQENAHCDRTDQGRRMLSTAGSTVLEKPTLVPSRDAVSEYCPVASTNEERSPLTGPRLDLASSPGTMVPSCLGHQRNPSGSVLYELQLSYGLFGKASEESITIIHPAGDESMHKFL
ncbi:hypothetical protein PO909_030435 [Leuciscus waleckii]